MTIVPTLKAVKLQQKILTDEEVRYLSEKLRQSLGGTFSEMAQQYGLSIEDHFRFSPLAARLVNARNTLDLSLKEAAAALKVAQHRLADIENARTNDLSPDLVVRYVEYLGIKVWFARWKRANAELAARLQLNKTGNLTARWTATRKSGARRQRGR